MKPTTSIGWSAKELIWLNAALSLPAYDFLMALEDISSMSGRTISAVASKAKAIRRESAPHKPMLAAKKIPATPEAWVLRQPSKADLMGSR